MKKVLFLILSFSLIATSFAASSYFYIPKKATEIYIPVTANKQISLMELSTMKVKDYENLSGKRLNFFQKIAFKNNQKQLRKSIAADGTIKNDELVKSASASDLTTGFHLGGFALGLFLGPIGVLIAYLIHGDASVDKNRIKWSWIGFAVAFLLWLLIL
jgi:hypothetical protein